MGDVGARQLVEGMLRRFSGSITMETKLDFLERLSWLMEDEGAELREVRRQWLRERREPFLELALMPWGTVVTNSAAEASQLLDPLRSDARYQGRAEERLSEVLCHAGLGEDT